MPALLQTTWTAPNAVERRVAQRLDRRVVGHVGLHADDVEPVAPGIRRPSSPVARPCTSASTTRMPSRAKRSPIARPRPPAPPVTTATRPARVCITRSRRPTGRRSADGRTAGSSRPARCARSRRTACCDRSANSMKRTRAHGQVGDRIELRLAQDDLAIDLEHAIVSSPRGGSGRATDRRRSPCRRIEQELEVEVGALAVGRERRLTSDASVDLDERDAHAGRTSPRIVSPSRSQRDVGRASSVRRRSRARRPLPARWSSASPADSRRRVRRASPRPRTCRRRTVACPAPMSTVANVTRTSGSALGVSGCGSTAAIASGSVS